MNDTDGSLRELYQELIFDHNRHPRNFHAMVDADHFAEGHNPLCGDQLAVYLRIGDGIVEDISFVGQGCAISTASASLMTEAVKGRTVAEVEALFKEFHAQLTDATSAGRDMGKLGVLTGVREFPTRVKCATLAWHTLHNALGGIASTAHTE